MSESPTIINESSARSDFLNKEIASWNSFIVDNKILNSKYRDMKESEFRFFRATAHLFYKDIDSGVISIPTEWKETPKIKTWILGDFHTQNIGFFENSEGKIKLDVNDFDESYIAPFYLDLMRFTTSIFLQRNGLKFKLDNKEIENLAEHFLKEYQETLKEISDAGKELELIEDNLDGFSKDALEELKDEKSKLLSKWTKLDGMKRSFDFANKDLEQMEEVEFRELQSNWNDYLESLGEFSNEKGYSFFQILDIARRLNSGTGSKGVNKYYVLIQGENSPVILEVKEQRLPCLFQMKDLSEAEYYSYFSNHAERARTAGKAMLANPDLFFGTLTIANRNYLISRISPFKKKLEPKDFHSESDFKRFIDSNSVLETFTFVG